MDLPGLLDPIESLQGDCSLELDWLSWVDGLWTPEFLLESKAFPFFKLFGVLRGLERDPVDVDKLPLFILIVELAAGAPGGQEALAHLNCLHPEKKRRAVYHTYCLSILQ